MRELKGIDYRYVVIVLGKWDTGRLTGKKKYFISRDKAERYCEHLDRNNKEYRLYDMYCYEY